MDLSQFIDTYREAITRQVIDHYPPRYRPSADQRPLPRLLRRPMDGQENAIRGTALSLESQKGSVIVGEMGCGKTFIGAAAAHLAGFRRVLVLAPPHLTRKWQREVRQTIPGAQAPIINSITGLEKLKKLSGGGPLFGILSRERAKLSYRWKPATVERWTTYRSKTAGKVPCCPGCFAPATDGEDLPLSSEELARRRQRCRKCGGALWTADRRGSRRFALADYMKRRMRDFWQLLIADEVHEYKARGSAQGIAAGTLAGVCGKSLTLTGTLSGGYASTLFHLLYRFSPEIRSEFGQGDEHRWVKKYGFEETTVGKKDDDEGEDGRQSRRRQYRKRVRERPGLAPAALLHLIGNSVFLRLSDVASGLPPYDEEVLLTGLDQGKDPGAGISQAEAYGRILAKLKAALSEALNRGSKRLLATYLQTLLAYPDGCTRGETVFDPESGELIVQVPPLAGDKLYPKEKALADLIAAEKLQGRRTLVYVTHTGVRDITPRWSGILARQGLRVAVLKADTVSPEQREAWVAQRVEEGVDVLMCHPRLVQTGLDLVDFPTIIWAETDYSVYTMRQASRRSWRIGQDRPVKVVFLAYRNTLQADGLRLVARKLQSSLMVEGELPEEGLAAYGDDGQDVMLALAHQVIGDGGDGGEDPVEEVFEKYRAAQAAGEEYLVDEGWEKDRVPPGREPEANGSQANGSQANGSQANGSQANGSQAKEEEDRPVQLNLAEFLKEEPAPKRGKRRVPPASQTLFAWAMEEIREKAPV